MWLMTKFGFYSIVKKDSDVYQVRSREKKDVENLVQNVPILNANIIETSNSDYAVRILVGQDDLHKILSFLGETLDYSNFKNEIGMTTDQAHKPYHEVWQVMADALGSYGRAGTATGKDSD